MLKTVLVLGALAVVFAAAWLAFRRAREPERPDDDNAYMRNIRATTGDFGRRSPPTGEMDPMNAPTFPPPSAREP